MQYDLVPKSIHVCCNCRIIIVLLVSWLVVYLMSALCDIPASQIMIIETYSRVVNFTSGMIVSRYCTCSLKHVGKYV